MAKIKYGKLSRREGVALHPKAEKIIAKKSNPPGQHGITGARRRRLSEYGVQLREKQKTKRAFGISEKQFANYFTKAHKMSGMTGELILRLLEMRLDNVLYRAGLAKSRPLARQLVTHGHILVNDKKVNIPSYQVSVGDIISVKERSAGNEFFKGLAAELKDEGIPNWISLIPKELKAKVESVPERSDMDESVSEQLIVEFYSR